MGFIEVFAKVPATTDQRRDHLLPAMAAHLVISPVKLTMIQNCRSVLLTVYRDDDVSDFLLAAIAEAKLQRARVL